DDRIDILEGLKEVFSKHPEYIPKGMKLKLQAGATDVLMRENEKFPTVALSGTGPILDQKEVQEIYSAACDHVNSLKESMRKAINKRIRTYTGAEELINCLGTISIPLFKKGFSRILENFNMKESDVRSKYIETIEQKYKTVQEQKVLKKIQMLIKKAKARKNSPMRILASIITKTENQDKAHDEFIKNLENLEKEYKQISAEDAVLLLAVGEKKTASSSGQVTSILENLSEEKYKTVLEDIAMPESKKANEGLSKWRNRVKKVIGDTLKQLKKNTGEEKNKPTGVKQRITPDKGGR
ncbi:MAG: hypothetical protein VX737_04185, partial [Pseudomonadota bacterium]|nr:hypothetical protein [Pseudomonadota bacterium]